MILTALVLAATADLQVFSVTPSKTAVAYDETFRVTARVRNLGPDAAPDTFVSIGGNAPGMVLSVEAPARWTCRGAGSPAVECRTPSFAAGAEAELSVVLTAPQPTPIEYRVGANIGATSNTDASFRNNSLNVDMELLHPQRHADLGVTVALERNPVPEGGEVRATLDVRNNGPDDARDVVVAITPIGDSTFGSIFTVSASGAGWNCVPAGENVLCSRPELRAGASAPIVVRGAAPAREARLSIGVRVRAEANRDSVNGNNSASPSIGVGSAANWQRLLLPITTDFLQGASAAWVTEISALILADEQPQFAPHPCEFISILCYYEPPPVRRQMDAFEHLVFPSRFTATGQYFYVRPADANKFRFNARIYDAARFDDTAGAEVPVVRDGDFTSDVIALLNVPVAPQYRHTLRIYDADGRDRTLARIRIYSGDELEPRLTIVRELRRFSSQVTTTALLPTHPAFAQDELSQLLPLADLEPLRVEIEPVDPAVRLWAFISITNNETHHVTLVTPQ